MRKGPSPARPQKAAVLWADVPVPQNEEKATPPPYGSQLPCQLIY